MSTTLTMAPEPARDRRELEALVARLSSSYPDVEAATLAELVDTAWSKLADAPVQSYRLLITERSVRRTLAAAASTTG